MDMFKYSVVYLMGLRGSTLGGGGMRRRWCAGHYVAAGVRGRSPRKNMEDYI